MGNVLTQDVPSMTWGAGTLSAGTITITDANAKTTSKIMLTSTSSGAVNLADIRVSSKSNGSFVVTSLNILDVTPFDYVIFN
jgi:hypothetical protein